MEGGARLRIHIFNASGLRAADTYGLSDPYVIGELDGKPHTQFRTRAITQTLEPEWDEQHTIEGFEANDVLLLRVMDEDNVVKQTLVGDDFLGSAELSADELYRGFFGELHLADEGDGHEGAVLRLSATVEPCGDCSVGGSFGGGDTPPQAPPPRRASAASSSGRARLGGDTPPLPGVPDGPGPSAVPGLCLGVGPTLGPGVAPVPGAGPGPGVAPPGPAPGMGDTSAGSGARARRLSVTIVGAQGLRDADWLPGTGKSDPYCVCEVPGKRHTRFRTEVIANTLEPVWNKTCEFDYTPNDPLEFIVFDKDVWPKSDDFLGKAVLLGEKFFPYGFDGELVLDDADGSPGIMEAMSDTFGKMLRHGKEESRGRRGSRGSVPNAPQAVLRVKVTVLGSLPMPGNTGHIQPTSQVPTRPPSAGLSALQFGVQSIKVLIQGVRDMCSADKTSRRDLYCVCQIPGRPGPSFHTRAASGTGSRTWHHEQEIPDYSPGEGLEFVVVDRADFAALGTSHAGYLPAAPEGLVGSGLLSSEQFLPYGYDAELTLSYPGQGIQGLLRVKVTVPRGPSAHAPGVAGAAARVAPRATEAAMPLRRQALQPHAAACCASPARAVLAPSSCGVGAVPSVAHRAVERMPAGTSSLVGRSLSVDRSGPRRSEPLLASAVTPRLVEPMAAAAAFSSPVLAMRGTLGTSPSRRAPHSLSCSAQSLRPIVVAPPVVELSSTPCHVLPTGEVWRSISARHHPLPWQTLPVATVPMLTPGLPIFRY